MTLPSSESTMIRNVKLEVDDENRMDVDMVEEPANPMDGIDSEEEEGQVSEEGEIWDSGGPDSPVQPNNAKTPTESNRNFRGFTTILEEAEEPDAAKLEERAKRFGLDPSEPRPILSKKIRNLYESMGVDPHDKLFRLNTIHMEGTENMNTQDVFDYFKEYAPIAVEWIKDSSCNVVWIEEITAARALMETSKKIITDSRSNGTIKYNEEFLSDTEIAPSSNKKDEDKDAVKVSDLKTTVPPGIWRKGKDCPKSDSIFLRFATFADKKVMNNIKNNDYINKFGMISSHRQPPFGNERMFRRPHYDVGDEVAATDARAKLLSKTGNPWSSIAYTWGMFDRTKYPVKNFPPEKKEEDNFFAELPKHSPLSSKLGIVSEDGEEWRSRIRAPRMRMHADDEASAPRRVLKPSRRSNVMSRLGGKEVLEIAPLQIKVERGSSISDNEGVTEAVVSDSAPIEEEEEDLEEDSPSTLQITRVVSPVQRKRPTRKAVRRKKIKKRKVESSSSSSDSSSDDESSSDSSSSSSSSGSSSDSSSSSSSSGSSSSSSDSSSSSSSSGSSSSSSSSSSSDSESDTEKVARKKVKVSKSRKSVLQGAQSRDRQRVLSEFSTNYDDEEDDFDLPIKQRSAVHCVSMPAVRQPHVRDLRFTIKNSRNNKLSTNRFKPKRLNDRRDGAQRREGRFHDVRRDPPLGGITDLREKLRNRKMNKVSRLKEDRFDIDSPLQIEVDNDLYYRR